MTLGRFRIIRGLKGSGGNALPRINMDATDLEIASIQDDAGNPLLRYDINPVSIAAAPGLLAFGKDRASKNEIRATRGIALIESEPLFGGNPAFSFPADASPSGNLALYGSVASSFTFFTVCTIDAALKSSPATARLMYLVNTTAGTLRASMGFNANSNLIFGISNSATDTAFLGGSNVPAADVPFVLAGVYDAVAQRFRIYLNSTALTDSSDNTVTVTPASTDIIGIGGPAGYSGSNGWKGLVARQLVYDGALNVGQIDTVMSALITKYVAF